MIFLNQLISAIIQLLFFTSIPFVWYVVTNRKVAGFFQWIGFKLVPKPPIRYMIMIFVTFLVIISLPYLWLYSSGSIRYSGFTIESFRQTGWGLQTICIVLIWAIVQTSLTEEILFRGFLCKRLSDKWGWKVGNSIQAFLFGIIHIPAVLGTGLFAIVVVFLLTGGVGFALGWLLQQKTNGSILYGWCIHAAVNIVSPIFVFSFLL